MRNVLLVVVCVVIFLFGDVCDVAVWVYAGTCTCCLSWRIGEFFSRVELCIFLRGSPVRTGMGLRCIKDYIYGC